MRRRRQIGSVLSLVAAVLVLAGPTALAAPVPEGAVWSEHYLESGDGTRLHADMLRPAHLPPDVETPVILTVSPYLNRSGIVGERPTGSGPSDRFYDFLEQGDVFERGYTYVMVDLRGTGGSAGCNDWGGPGEQMDVKAAVEWAGAQPWSTGRVGLYGKSYDGWTGLMGLAQDPEHLAAVVSQEPVYDGYRYLYMNRVRYPNFLGTPLIFQVIDANPGSAFAGTEYVVNGAGSNDPLCYADNVASQQSDDPDSTYWSPRNLIPTTRGSDVPTFLMQGFLEDNTKPDMAFTVWNGLGSEENRAWFGQWDHVRGNDTNRRGEPLTGREGFIEEVMRFYAEHLKGVEPAVEDPAVVVQGGDGRFRAEEEWPPADSVGVRFELLPGSYRDDLEGNRGDATAGGPNGRGSWTFSPPLRREAHLAGTPRLEVTVETEARDANLVANVYDVDEDGRAMLLSRGAYLVPESGTYRFETYGQDWPIAPGHRIGVLISGANDEWWTHVPTGTAVELESATMELPFLTQPRDEFIDGGPAAKLLEYREEAPFRVPAETVAEREAPFAPPGGQAARPAISGAAGG